MQEFIKYLVCNLVDHPEEVEIRETRGSNVLLIEIKVAPKDVGKVIGKQGKTISALRTMMNSVASRQSTLRVSLEILEPEHAVAPDSAEERALGENPEDGSSSTE